MNVEQHALTDESAVRSTIEVELREANERLRLAEHEKKSRIIELQCELEYQRKRADEIEAKFKKEMAGSNSDGRIQQLTEQLSKKENEILEIRAREIQKKRGLALRVEELKLEVARLPKLEQTVKSLEGEVTTLKEQLQRVKEGAVQAILEKQGIIASLEEELRGRSSNQQTTEFLELREKFDELTDKFETETKAYEARLEQRRLQVTKLNERLQSDQQQFQERLIRLQGEINQRMEHNITETLNSAKVQESSLLQSMESLQQKLHRSEARALQLQTELERKKMQSQSDRRKLEDQRDELMSKYTSQMTASNRQIELLAKARQRDVAQLQQTLDKLKESSVQMQKKLQQAEAKAQVEAVATTRPDVAQNLRKISKGSFSEKSEEADQSTPVGLTSEIEDIKALEDSNNFKFNDWMTNATGSKNEDETIEPTAPQLVVVQPQQSSFDIKGYAEYLSLQAQNERLKKELQDLQHTLESNSNEIARITKELQGERQSCLDLTNRRSELVVELQSLRSHTFKVESTLLTQKLKHAEQLDYVKQSFMVERKQFTIKLIRLNEEKGDMLIELDKLRKKTGTSTPLTSPIKFIKKP